MPDYTLRNKINWNNNNKNKLFTTVSDQATLN